MFEISVEGSLVSTRVVGSKECLFTDACIAVRDGQGNVM